LADKSRAYKVRATTRNTKSDLAQCLAAAGVEVVKSDGLIKQEMLDATFEAGVKHVVFSSLASATESSGGKVPNDAFDGKSFAMMICHHFSAQQN
jgi:hypothetical protein